MGSYMNGNYAGRDYLKQMSKFRREYGRMTRRERAIASKGFKYYRIRHAIDGMIFFRCAGCKSSFRYHPDLFLFGKPLCQSCYKKTQDLAETGFVAYKAPCRERPFK